MVGLVFKILIDLVKVTAGDEAVDRVRRQAQVPPDRDYRLNAVYEDAEWQRLVAAACEVLDLTPEQAEAAYAAHFLQDSLGRWRMWFQMSRNSREFLLRQPAIHNSLAAGVSEEVQRSAIADKFRIETTDDGIITHYRSANGHCGLYRALARGVVDHYGDEATIEEPRCARRGDDECEIHVRWTKYGVKP